MRNKVIISVIMSCAIGLMLTGCGHEHIWTEATCLSPKTCSECGETEGEAADHSWLEATCENPKTCSVCGATDGEALEHKWLEADCRNPKTCSECGTTDGEALGHDWTEATYWTKKKCSTCGKTEGKVIESDFEKYGMSAEMELEQKYDMMTANGKEGTVKVYNYYCDYNIDKFESLDGYILQEVYSDMNYIDPYNKVYSNLWSEDYYDIEGHDNTIVDITADYPKWDYVVKYTVHWNDKDYTECVRWWYSEWVGNTERTHYIWQVPEGYDGNALGVIDASNGKEGNYSYELFDENSTFLRLPAAIPSWK